MRKVLHSVSKETKRWSHMVTEVSKAPPPPNKKQNNKTKQNMKVLIKGC